MPKDKFGQDGSTNEFETRHAHSTARKDTKPCHNFSKCRHWQNDHLFNKGLPKATALPDIFVHRIRVTIFSHDNNAAYTKTNPVEPKTLQLSMVAINKNAPRNNLGLWSTTENPVLLLGIMSFLHLSQAIDPIEIKIWVTAAMSFETIHTGNMESESCQRCS